MSSFVPIAPDRLRQYLDDQAPQSLSEYFGSGRYTGGRFERLAGGGDRPEVADRFTSDDVVAASLLSVRVPGRASLQILDQQAKELGALLSEIPVQVDLWEVPEATVGPDSPAQALWQLLVDLPGVGWVTAGKLLARKRPQLIPVYDRVVKEAFGHEDEYGWWPALRAVLAENPDIVQRLRELRDGSGLQGEVSLLRVLDVSMWMREDGKPEPVPDTA